MPARTRWDSLQGLLTVPFDRSQPCGIRRPVAPSLIPIRFVRCVLVLVEVVLRARRVCVPILSSVALPARLSDRLKLGSIAEGRRCRDGALIDPPPPLYFAAKARVGASPSLYWKIPLNFGKIFILVF